MVSRKPDPRFTERKWVFETINKYFDVIKEDEELEDSNKQGAKSR